MRKISHPFFSFQTIRRVALVGGMLIATPAFAGPGDIAFTSPSTTTTSFTYCMPLPTKDLTSAGTPFTVTVKCPQRPLGVTMRQEPGTAVLPPEPGRPLEPACATELTRINPEGETPSWTQEMVDMTPGVSATTTPETNDKD